MCVVYSPDGGMHFISGRSQLALYVLFIRCRSPRRVAYERHCSDISPLQRHLADVKSPATGGAAGLPGCRSRGCTFAGPPAEPARWAGFARQTVGDTAVFEELLCPARTSASTNVAVGGRHNHESSALRSARSLITGNVQQLRTRQVGSAISLLSVALPVGIAQVSSPPRPSSPTTATAAKPHGHSHGGANSSSGRSSRRLRPSRPVSAWESG